MMKAFKRLLWVVFFIAILCGVGYGLYWYFTGYSAHRSSAILQPNTKSNEYLDTLVVEINNNLKNITTQLDIISSHFTKETFGFTALSIIILLNFLVIIVLCFLVASIRTKINKTLDKKE